MAVAACAARPMARLGDDVDHIANGMVPGAGVCPKHTSRAYCGAMRSSWSGPASSSMAFPGRAEVRHAGTLEACQTAAVSPAEPPPMISQATSARLSGGMQG